MTHKTACEIPLFEGEYIIEMKAIKKHLCIITSLNRIFLVEKINNKYECKKVLFNE